MSLTCQKLQIGSMYQMDDHLQTGDIWKVFNIEYQIKKIIQVNRKTSKEYERNCILDLDLEFSFLKRTYCPEMLIAQL